MRSYRRSLPGVILLFCGVFLVASRPAHAYIDPGSGSYALQVAIATLFGALLSVKVFWHKIKRFVADRFTGKRERNPTDAG